MKTLGPQGSLLFLTLTLTLYPGMADAQVVGPNVLVSVPPCGKLDNDPVVAAQGQQLVAAWRSDCLPRFFASASRDDGQTWEAANPIPWSGNATTPAAVCAGDSGRFYLVAPTQVFAVGRTIEVSEGRFVGTMFQWRRLTNPMPLPYGDDRTGNPDAMGMLFDTTSRNLYVTFTRTQHNPASISYVITFVRSTDGGESWDPPMELTGPESNGPRMIVGPDGALSVIWENYVFGKLMGRRSSDFGATFGPEFEVGAIADNVGIEPASWDGLKSRQNPAVPRSICMGAPAPFSLASDHSGGPHHGTMYLVTAEHAAGTAVPQTGGRFEVEPNRFYASANEIEIGDDVLGSVATTESSFDTDRFTFVGEAGRTIWISGSFSSSTNSPIHGFNLTCGDDTTAVLGIGCFDTTPDGSAPAAIYTFPRTGRYYLGTSAFPGSSIEYRLQLREYVVHPASVARDHRDILLSSSTDGGMTWSSKLRVNDGPAGNEEAFPEVVVDGSGRVHVAWYDWRNGAGCGDEVNTYWTYSDDGGQTFSAAMRVSQEGSTTHMTPSWAVGDRLGLAASGDRAHVLWTRILLGSSGNIYGALISDLPTSVLISGLAAEEADGAVGLRWLASDVREVREFRVHRAAGGGDYELVGIVPAGADGQYLWQDESIAVGVDYRYRLEVVRLDGLSLWDGPVGVSVAAPPTSLAWGGAIPNPFADSVELVLHTPDQGTTRVSVYDVAGHQVASLRAEPQGDRFVVRWKGRNGKGRVVAPGVYLVRAQLGASSVVRQIVRMK